MTNTARGHTPGMAHFKRNALLVKEIIHRNGVWRDVLVAMTSLGPAPHQPALWAVSQRALKAVRHAVLHGLLLGAGAFASPAALAAGWALLVGVTDYPQLQLRLEGPTNDLRLMHDTVHRLGIQPTQVLELSERAHAHGTPTQAHILAALDGLAKKVRPGDWLVFYFSGHGAQVPQSRQTRQRYAEPDGLDDVLLTRDTRHWNPKTLRVDGALADDVVGQRLSALARRGVRVWAVLDTCHASGMTRQARPMPSAITSARPAADSTAAPDAQAEIAQADIAKAEAAASADATPRAQDPAPVERFVGPAALNVPVRLWLRATQWSPRPGAPTQSGTTQPAPAPAPVVFAAAHKGEPATEEWFDDPLTTPPTPPARARRVRVGVMTYHLHRALVELTANTPHPPTFQQLAQALEGAYAHRPFPRPSFTGTLAQPLPGRR